MTIRPGSLIVRLGLSTIIAALLLQCQAQAWVRSGVSQAEAHPVATVGVSPDGIDDHKEAKAKRFNYGVPNVYEGKNLLQQLLNERRLERVIAEAEAAYERASEAAIRSKQMSGKRGGQLNKPRIMFAQNPHENALGKLKRRPKLDKALEDELNYAQQLATGIITDLRSILGDIQKDPSDPDRLLRLS